MEISLVGLDTLEYWRRFLGEEAAAAIIRENILPADIPFVSDGDIDLLLADAALLDKTKIKKLKSILQDFKPVMKREDAEEGTTETMSSSDDSDAIKVTKVINWKYLKKSLPKFKKSNLLTFFREVEIFCVTEELAINAYWFKILLKTIPWDEGTCKLVEEQEELRPMPWREGKMRVVQLIDPDFLIEWNEKLFTMCPNGETLEKYFIRFKSFVDMNNDYHDEIMLANVFIHSLPQFIQAEIRKLSSEGGRPVPVRDITIANNYLMIIFGNKYKTKIFSQKTKDTKQKVVKDEVKRVAETVKETTKRERLPYDEYIKTVVCHKCKERGHFGRKCPSIIARIEGGLNEISLLPSTQPFMMSIIINGKEVEGMIDSGASNTVIDEDFYHKQFGDFQPREVISATLADGSSVVGSRVGHLAIPKKKILRKKFCNTWKNLPLLP